MKGFLTTQVIQPGVIILYQCSVFLFNLTDIKETRFISKLVCQG